jgi:hypothetical protein
MRIHICIDDVMDLEFNAEPATGPSHSKHYESCYFLQADPPGHSTPIVGKVYIDLT